jgi:hypothetical protein
MRIAFFGHTYHRKTGSSRFFLDLLAQLGEVEERYEEPGPDAALKLGTSFDEGRYDAIVVFQLHEAFALLNGRHPNVVFVPMYDAMQWAGGFYWKPTFNAAKVVCFSWALRQEVMRRGAVQAGFQYYPDPARFEPVEDFATLRGFLWYRLRDISPQTVFRLTRGTELERLVVHDAPDPGHEASSPWPEPPANVRRLERTAWHPASDTYAAALRASNLFFAPRPFEGIGMSVLEAMAFGHCVVAPNAPTMNEYISHGTNGLIYVPGRRGRLDFSRARELGARARESVERGHRRWLASIPDLLDFVATPTAALRARGERRSIISVRDPGAPPPPETRGPLVSVVTVCRNAAAVLDDTMRSVLSQTGCPFEYVVLDGLSTDGSVEIIRRHADRLAAWRSSEDLGPYDAMNRSLELARGEYVLFMNAGDAFVSEDALHRMFSRVPADADVVYGHHVFRLEDGSEELRRAAGFEATWARLRRGDLWFDWLAGIPGHQATAIRRGLLADLRFDTRYRIAADHDLLFRACARGARFFACDEVVSLYVAGGLSMQQYERCRREWAEMTRTHGDATGAERFFAQLEAVSREVPAPHLVVRLSRLALGLIGALDARFPTLARVAERVVRSPRLRGAVRQLLGLPRTPSPAAPDDAPGPEDLEDGIDFRQHGLPDLLRSMEGVSQPEGWGRWTDGTRVKLCFRAPLPPRFVLELETHALARNTERLVRIMVGRTHAEACIGAEPGRRYRIPIANPDGASDTIVIALPDPVAPSRLRPGQSEDGHQLGLALVQLRILLAGEDLHR